MFPAFVMCAVAVAGGECCGGACALFAVLGGSLRRVPRPPRRLPASQRAAEGQPDAAGRRPRTPRIHPRRHHHHFEPSMPRVTYLISNLLIMAAPHHDTTIVFIKHEAQRVGIPYLV